MQSNYTFFSHRFKGPLPTQQMEMENPNNTLFGLQAVQNQLLYPFQEEHTFLGFVWAYSHLLDNTECRLGEKST